MQIAGYKIASSYSRSTRTGGGVCILLQEYIEYKEISAITDMSMEYILEVCACELPKENLLLITLYWNRREEDISFKQLKQILTYINNKYSTRNIIIGGDFNINILENNLKTNAFLDLMLEYKFQQHIKQATRISPTISTCLDLIFTNFNNDKLDVTVEELGFSDHCGTIIHLEIPEKNKKITWSCKKRIFNIKNMQLFKSKLSTLKWKEILSLNKNINENYDALMIKLSNILDECIPLRKIKLKFR